MQAAVESLAMAPAEEAARWLILYDMVAWHTSDLVMAESSEVIAQLGGVWFAYQDGEDWHAAYGGWDEEGDRYAHVTHYLMAADSEQFVKVDEPPDPAIADPVGRAVHSSYELIPPAWMGAGLRYNLYTRVIDEGIEVYWLPAWQPDSTIVIGNSASFTLDPEGRELLAQSSWEPGWATMQPDPTATVVLPSPTRGHPTVFELFFLMYYHDEFDLLMLDLGDRNFGVLPMEDGYPMIMQVLKEE
jgi:hypothetical protein